ncbi:MAG: hypothetical protein ABIF06_01050 [bacterium]
MTYKIGTISYNYRTRTFWFLILVLISLTLIQVYAVSATTKNVALRQNLEKQVLNMTTQQSSLEFAYINLKNEVSLEVAREIGFKEAKNPTFVSRRSSDSLGIFTLNR